MPTLIQRLANMMSLVLGLTLAAVAWGQVGGQEERWEDDSWGDDEAWDSDWGEGSGAWSGFLELGLGRRLSDDPAVGRRTTLAELRLELENEWQFETASVDLRIDALYDDVISAWRLDPREAALNFSPADNLDLKIGRQVLTWGTGDLLFLNDLFPKDFQSFFAGRDDVYLKAPSDAIRVSLFGDRLNLDAVWTPEFEPDRYLTGERFSFFFPLAGTIVAPDQGRTPAPDDFPSDGEISLRVFGTRGSAEWAIYGHRGFFKSPLGFDPTGRLTFPRLDVAGASLRGTGFGGLLNAELAWYRSAEDRQGTDPGVPNDQLRILLGYERELAPRLTLGLQGYVERTADHDALLANSPTPDFEPERTRTVLTTRLTHRAFRERLRTSLFAFVSPSDDDWHLRSEVSYRYSDAWSFSAGALLFGGEESNTFFNQLDANDNVYARIRRSF